MIGYPRAVTHGSKYRVEVISLGRQDWFFGTHNPVFRSAHLICGTAHYLSFYPSLNKLRVPRAASVRISREETAGAPSCSQS
jgi:hypothetical protein